jgi:hypothetical protein
MTNVVRCEGNEVLIENEDKKEMERVSGEIILRKPWSSKLLEDEDSVVDDEKGYHVLRLEFDRAAKDLKERKAPGINRRYTEFP